MIAQLSFMDPPKTKAYNGTVIYETKGPAREYRELACNLYKGCDHGCFYCYGPDATFTDRETFRQIRLRDAILAKIEKDAKKYGEAGETRQILLCFTTDPYCHLDVQHRLSRHAIQILHSHGLAVAILTKGGSRSLRDLDLLTPTDSYACTLTSLDPIKSREWEPEAALPADRISALEAFHRAGIPTWVSLEPVLDTAATLEIISRTAPIVDEFKVGKLNHYPQLEKEPDWRKFGLEAITLLKSLGKRYYIKRDLRAYLTELEVG